MTGEVKDYLQVKDSIEANSLTLTSPNIGGDYALKFKELENNGTENITISNVGPSGVGTATISKWLKIVDASDDTIYYIPLWT